MKLAARAFVPHKAQHGSNSANSIDALSSSGNSEERHGSGRHHKSPSKTFSIKSHFSQDRQRRMRHGPNKREGPGVAAVIARPFPPVASFLADAERGGRGPQGDVTGLLFPLAVRGPALIGSLISVMHRLGGMSVIAARVIIALLNTFGGLSMIFGRFVMMFGSGRMMLRALMCGSH